jgi:hypothetical protein
MYDRKKLAKEDIDTIRQNLLHRRVKLSNEPCCDFCGDSSPIWQYAAIRMSTGEYRECWRWLACVDCADAIESDEMGRIEDKLILWLEKKFPEVSQSVLRLIVRHALQEFHLYAKRKK